MRRIFTAFFIPLIAFCAAGEDPKEIVKGEIGEKLDAYFTALEGYGFNGVILVEMDGEVVIAKGYGAVHRDKEKPVTTDTVFTIGSITKQFTGAAIMKLVEAGKLSVDDKITKYFDNVPEERQEITIHQLLTHESGLRDIRKGDFDPVGREEFAEIALNAKPFVPPGKRHRYTNAGYSLLGAIIEQVTGTSYEEYVRQVFFNPLEMDDTGYILADWEDDQVAHGYLRDEYWGRVIDKPFDKDGPYWVLRANGGIHSTVWDMYTWHKALLDDSVLSDASRKQMFTKHAAENKEATTHYGYGWGLATTQRGTELISHNGGNGIFFADMRRYVGDGVLILYMTSTAQLIQMQHERDIRSIVFGYDVEMPPPDAHESWLREE